MVQDEIHHLEVCARVLEELDPGARGHRALECALGPRTVPDETVLARTLVTEFALGKPVTAAAFAAARAVVREPLFGWAYTELLHDETRHATFGARAAAWVIRDWSTRQRQALWTECLTDGRGHRATLARATPRPKSSACSPARSTARCRAGSSRTSRRSASIRAPRTRKRWFTERLARSRRRRRTRGTRRIVRPARGLAARRGRKACRP